MRVLFRGLGAAVLSACLLAPSALAAPVTVDLRIEGPTRTIFEGPVTTDVRPWKFSDESTEHQCDATSATGGPSAVPVPTRNAALMAAAYGATPFSVTGTWFSFGPSIEELGGESTAYDSATGSYLVEYHNWQVDMTYGGCSRQVSSGDSALFAYATGSEPLLKLTGPATARPGEAVTVKVVDGASDAPVSGATVAGATTGADGTAVVGPFSARGPQALKAEKPGAIRSNRLAVCVTDGQDGACGTSVPGAAPAPVVADSADPVSVIAGIKQGKVFRRGKAPRVLRGTIADASGLRFVKLRLTRNAGGRCSSYSRTRERFIRRPCGAEHGWWFSIGDKAEWDFQLASRLPRGRYVLDVKAWDRSWNVDAERRLGKNRVVFRVK